VTAGELDQSHLEVAARIGYPAAVSALEQRWGISHKPPKDLMEVLDLIKPLGRLAMAKALLSAVEIGFADLVEQLEDEVSSQSAAKLVDLLALALVALGNWTECPCLSCEQTVMRYLLVMQRLLHGENLSLAAQDTIRYVHDCLRTAVAGRPEILARRSFVKVLSSQWAGTAEPVTSHLGQLIVSFMSRGILYGWRSQSRVIGGIAKKAVLKFDLADAYSSQYLKDLAVGLSEKEEG
jgi:hypothetical protein